MTSFHNNWLCGTLLTLSLLCGCGPGESNASDAATADVGVDVEESDVTTSSLRLGVVDETGHFKPLKPNDEVDIVVGFQGLLHVDLAATGPADMPRVVSGEAEVHFDNQKFDFSDPKNRIHFDGEFDGRRLCERFRVRFGLDLSQLKGKQVEVEAKLEKDSWQGRGTTQFTIVDKK